MKILYIGHTAPESTSRHRAGALTRLGHEVIMADPYAALATHLHGRLRGAFHYRTGYRLLQPRIKRWLANQKLQLHHFDIAWVDSGELLGVDCIRLLRSAGLLTHGTDGYTVTTLGADLLKRLNDLQAFAGKWVASQTKAVAAPPKK